MYSVDPAGSRHFVAVPTFVALVALGHLTALAPTVAAQAAKPDVCQWVDAAEMLQLTGLTDHFGKGSRGQVS